MSEVLDNEDVYQLTRRKHLQPQKEILDAMGIKYYIHHIDNIVIIPRSSLSLNDTKKLRGNPNGKRADKIIRSIRWKNGA